MIRALASSAATAAVLAVSTLVGTIAQAATPIPKSIFAAVADPNRPDADRNRDAERKPAETIAFAGIKPGQRIAEIIPGGGYFTRIFSVVVGSKGHVYALAPPRRPTAAAGSPDPAAAVQAIAADPHYANVSVTVGPMTAFSVPEPVDLVWTSLNYHDLHNIPNADLAAIDKMIFAGLKPGGVFIVLDHAAEAGSGFRDTSTLHRIDADAVEKEVVSAGFTFEGKSDLLKNPEDTHTVAVFDPSVRGKTDQFILKFRKPK